MNTRAYIYLYRPVVTYSCSLVWGTLANEQCLIRKHIGGQILIECVGEDVGSLEASCRQNTLATVWKDRVINNNVASEERWMEVSGEGGRRQDISPQAQHMSPRLIWHLSNTCGPLDHLSTGQVCTGCSKACQLHLM